MAKSLAGAIISNFIEYDTPMIVHVKNRKLGIINRLVQVLIVVYIIGYAIIYQKGYQEFGELKSAISTKVKGIAFDNNSFGPLTWDVADYVIPPQETNAFFVTTSIIPSLKQKHSFCAEHPNVQKVYCKSDSDCEKFKGAIFATGPLTGKCVNSTIIKNLTICEIFGWCPVEDDNKNRMIIFETTSSFTVLIKNNIEFPKFDVARRNLIKIYENDTELSKCRWNRNDPVQKYCPIFKFSDITNDIGVDFASMIPTGGLMKIIIDWTCNLDYDIEECLPYYSFSRLDKGNYTSSPGFNFRYADHFLLSDTDGTLRMFRNLYKVYGVHFIIEVRGMAGKFSIVPLVLNLGNGMALLGIASVICDILLLYLLKSRELYKRKKYLYVTENTHEKLKEESHDNTEDKNRTESRNAIVDGNGLVEAHDNES